jgi:transcriptional regulator of acetoin/glycerol metabolism
VASRIVAQRRSHIEGADVCVSVTDPDGVILKQWSGTGRVPDTMRHLDIVPGFRADEGTIGTSSASTLVTGRPILVQGPEHFASQFSSLTSAGMVIRHPARRRTEGTLNLTCRFADTTPLALAWVCEMVTEIERVLLQDATRAEHMLMERFLSSDRDSRHPVAVLSERTMVTNAAAATLLGGVAHEQLWGHAASNVTENGETRLPGSEITAHCDPVYDDDELIGVVLRLRSPRSPTPRARPSVPVAPDPRPRRLLPGVAGRGERWTAMLRSIERAGRSPLLLVGEPGTGKAAVARALARGTTTVELDALAPSAPGGPPAAAWTARLDDAIATAPTHLIVRHIDRLPPEALEHVGSSLSEADPATRLLATAAGWEGTEPLAWVVPVLVPTLSERVEDIPEIVAELTSQHAHLRQDGEAPVRWGPDALRVLQRLDWPDNVRSLEVAVRVILNAASGHTIGARHLPADLVVRASRRPLHGLERAEALLIRRTLHGTGGNLVQAARELGIARSTLYRKMRSFDIDPEAPSF